MGLIGPSIINTSPHHAGFFIFREKKMSDEIDMKLFAIKLSIIGADGTPEVVVTALHSASAMDAAIHALGQYPALVSLSVKPVKE